MVVNKLAGGWLSPLRRTEDRMNPTGSGWTEIDYTDPRRVLEWGWFRSLSSEQPALVADAIRNLPTQGFDLWLGHERELTSEELEHRRAWLSYMAALPMR